MKLANTNIYISNFMFFSLFFYGGLNLIKLKQIRKILKKLPYGVKNTPSYVQGLIGSGVVFFQLLNYLITKLLLFNY